MQSPKAANPFLPVLSFWLAPSIGGVIYVAIDSFTREPAGHGFEYGAEGFKFGSMILLLLTSINTVGFLVAYLPLRRVAGADPLRLNIVCAATGIACLFAFQIVGLVGRNIVSTSSDLFWISFFVFGAILISAGISFLILFAFGAGFNQSSR